MPGGTCQNLPNGNFYTCNCDTAGYESNGGDPSTGQLGCQGRSFLTNLRSNTINWVYCHIFLTMLFTFILSLLGLALLIFQTSMSVKMTLAVILMLTA